MEAQAHWQLQTQLGRLNLINKCNADAIDLANGLVAYEPNARPTLQEYFDSAFLKPWTEISIYRFSGTVDGVSVAQLPTQTTFKAPQEAVDASTLINKHCLARTSTSSPMTRPLREIQRLRS